MPNEHFGEGNYQLKLSKESQKPAKNNCINKSELMDIFYNWKPASTWYPEITVA